MSSNQPHRPRRERLAGSQLSVWLPDSLRDMVEHAAESEGITAAAVCRRALIRDLGVSLPRRERAAS